MHQLMRKPAHFIFGSLGSPALLLGTPFERPYSQNAQSGDCNPECYGGRDGFQ
jgi:hypothetical protein